MKRIVRDNRYVTEPKKQPHSSGTWNLSKKKKKEEDCSHLTLFKEPSWTTPRATTATTTMVYNAKQMFVNEKTYCRKNHLPKENHEISIIEFTRSPDSRT